MHRKSTLTIIVLTTLLLAVTSAGTIGGKQDMIAALSSTTAQSSEDNPPTGLAGVWHGRIEGEFRPFPYHDFFRFNYSAEMTFRIAGEERLPPPGLEEDQEKLEQWYIEHPEVDGTALIKIESMEYDEDELYIVPSIRMGFRIGKLPELTTLTYVQDFTGALQNDYLSLYSVPFGLREGDPVAYCEWSYYCYDFQLKEKEEKEYFYVYASDLLFLHFNYSFDEKSDSLEVLDTIHQASGVFHRIYSCTCSEIIGEAIIFREETRCISRQGGGVDCFTVQVPYSLKADSSINPGDTVVTERDGIVGIDFSDGTHLDMSEESKMRVRRLYYEAATLYLKGKYGEALRDVGVLLTLYPNNENALELKGKIEFLLGWTTEEELKYHERYEEFKTEEAAELYYDAIDEYLEGDYKQSLLALTWLLRLEPSNWYALGFREKVIALIELAGEDAEKLEESFNLLDVSWGEFHLLISDSSRLVVKTPTSIVNVRGTEFVMNVTEDNTTCITVIEGVVELSDLERTKTVLVQQHETSYTRPGGTPSDPESIDPSRVDRWWEKGLSLSPENLLYEILDLLNLYSGLLASTFLALCPAILMFRRYRLYVGLGVLASIALTIWLLTGEYLVYIPDSIANVGNLSSAPGFEGFTLFLPLIIISALPTILTILVIIFSPRLLALATSIFGIIFLGVYLNFDIVDILGITFIGGPAWFATSYIAIKLLERKVKFGGKMEETRKPIVSVPSEKKTWLAALLNLLLPGLGFLYVGSAGWIVLGAVFIFLFSLSPLLYGGNAASPVSWLVTGAGIRDISSWTILALISGAISVYAAKRRNLKIREKADLAVAAPPSIETMKEGDPRQILKSRYAKGEISKEEYEEATRILGYPELQAQSTARKCPYCGTEVGEEALYCANCGSRIAEVDREAAIPPEEKPLLDLSGEGRLQLIRCETTANRYNVGCPSCLGTNVIPSMAFSEPGIDIAIERMGIMKTYERISVGRKSRLLGKTSVIVIITFIIAYALGIGFFPAAILASFVYIVVGPILSLLFPRKMPVWLLRCRKCGERIILASDGTEAYLVKKSEEDVEKQ